MTSFLEEIEELSKQIISLLMVVHFLLLGLFSSIVYIGFKQGMRKITEGKNTKEKLKRLKF